MIADSTLEVAINILENRVEFGINSKDYLSEYDDLITQVKKKFDDYATTVKDSIDKAQALHEQIVEYTNLINANQVITKATFGDIGSIKQPLGNTAVDKLNSEFSQRGINVKWFGAVGDGFIDDTHSIQMAINSLQSGDTLFFEHGKTYKVTGLTISGMSNVKINGNGSTLSLVDGSDVFAIYYAGTNDFLDIFGFKVIGNVVTGKTTAVGCHSGSNLTNSKIHGLIIENVNVGITLNAELSGDISNNDIFGNKITNILGADAGTGYGIHIANANQNKIHDNLIDHAQRHSIYHAFGNNNDIYHNTILNHRIDINASVGRGAIQIVRATNNLRVFDNSLINCFDGSIIISALDEIGDMTNVDIFNNNFISPQGKVPVIRVGDDGTATPTYISKNIKIHNNNFSITGLQEGVVIDKGIQVFVENNNFDYLSLTDRTSGISVKPKVASSLDMVFLSNNKFRVNGTGYQKFVGIYFSSLAPTDSNIHITANNNLFPTIYNNSGKKFTDYSTSATVTNTNLLFKNDMKRMVDAALTPPSSGYYTLGSICWSSNPNSTGSVGWVCTTGGAPGVWKKFGALI